MSSNSWLQNIRSALAPGRGHRQRQRRGSLRAATHRLNLEALEDRCLLSFSPATSYPVGPTPQALVSADFNNDGRLDLATANAGDNTVSMLLGNADGTFQPAQTSTTGAGPVSVAVGDFNNDGKLDMATANAHDVSVLLGNGNGTFKVPTNISIGSEPAAVAVGDFNGDGLLDLGVTSNVYYPGESSDPGWYVANANVLLGNGNGSFSGPNVTPLFVWGFPSFGLGYHGSAVAADVNGDGFDDFVAVNIDQGYVSVLLGDSSGYLQGPSAFSTGESSFSVAAGDLDADGDIDLVTTNLDGKNVGVLLGNGFGSFTSGGNYPTSGSFASVVLGDFTGDGKVDVATTNVFSVSGIYTYHLSVLYGRGDGTLSPAVNFAVGSYPSAVATGDFNGDGWLDAATANPHGSYVSVLINDQSWSDSSPPPPSVSVQDITVTEGNTGTTNVSFAVTLSAAYNQDVTVHYATANITAAAGSDYTAASGTVTIPAGQTTRAIAVAVKADRLPEPTETFAVNLSAPTNATIGDAQAICTILDNEPRISISDVTKNEGKKNQTTLFTFIVTLSAAYDQPVTMSFKTSNGTAATSDNDYVAKSGTLTFKPGETTKTITIEVKGDSKKEANETFYLGLFGNSSNSLFTKSRGTGTILNDD
jgi:hypothetical protein